MRVNWREEEIILLLSYYKRMRSGDMHKSHPLVLEASEAIRGLEINQEYSSKSTKFRNPNGIALKLANFLFLDPNYSGKGMKGCSVLDKKIFNEVFMVRDLDLVVRSFASLIPSLGLKGSGMGQNNVFNGLAQDLNITYAGSNIRDAEDCFMNTSPVISFGLGRFTSVPWIVFTNYGQELMDGIYPVLLFYPEHNQALLCYGISETKKPKITWGQNLIGNLSMVKDTINSPDKYGESVVHSSYSISELSQNIGIDKLTNNLSELINNFHMVFETKPKTPNQSSDYNKGKYPFKFENWLASNDGAVRRPMDPTSGRPLGNEIITGRVHDLISQMITDYISKSGKFICVFIGGPGNGKTDIMEFAAKEFVTKLGRDWDTEYKKLKAGFEKNNRQSILDLNKGTGLILTQDASQKDRGSKDFCEAIYNDLIKIDQMDAGLCVICMNRGILEEVNKRANSANEPLNKYKEFINKLYKSNSLDAYIENIKVWGNTDIQPYSLYSWSMDLDTLFNKSKEMTIDKNLIHEIFKKGNCNGNFLVINNELSPIFSAKSFVAKGEMHLNFSQILRSYEILYGKRFTYREIFNVIGYLFNYSETQYVLIESKLNEYTKISVDSLVDRFTILFELYRETYSYRFFDCFLSPKTALRDKCIGAFKDEAKKTDVKRLFNCFKNNTTIVREFPDLVKDSDFFDPIGCGDDIKIEDNDQNKFSFDQLRKKVIYNTNFNVSDFDNFLSPLEVEIIECLMRIKQEFCLNTITDDINHRSLNALDSLKSFLNILILAFLKRSLFFSKKYIRDKTHIDAFLNLIEGSHTDRQTFSENTFIDSLIDKKDRKIAISLVTSIGQTPSQFNNNVFYKGVPKHLEAIAEPTEELPSLDQVILRHQNSLNDTSTNTIVITYNLFREIQRASNELLKGCFDKNFTLWQELKKSEIVRTGTQINEINIDGIGKIQRDQNQNFSVTNE